KASGVSGIFYGLDPGLGQLGAQAIGSLVIIFVMGGVAYLFFKICNAVTKGGIRPAEDVELQGIDREEMGVIAYNDLTLAELVLDEGIALWFAFGRRLFLPKEEVTVRVNTGSSVAYPEVFRRFGYPLTDGILERRHKLLRAVLVEHGFRIA